ncbi:MAG TPA: hypothetical protein VGE85_06205 [Terracidiphilus sp.]
MKRWTLTVLLMGLLIPAVSYSAKGNKPAVDLTKMNHIFIGWVDLNPEAYFDLGYSRAEWEDVIRHANMKLQEHLKTQCDLGRVKERGATSVVTSLEPRFESVTGAKDSKDENTAGSDLFIKFSEASFDTKYVLHLSVHLIDLKTNTEVAIIPLNNYKGHLCGLVDCLDQELDTVNVKLEEQLSCIVPKR